MIAEAAWHYQVISSAHAAKSSTAVIAFGGGPVGHDHAFKSPLISCYICTKVMVIGCMDTIYQIVAGHNGQWLDRELITSHRLYVPALRKEAWFPYLEESDLFRDFNGNIMLCKHYRYSPVYVHEHEFFEILCVYDGTTHTEIQGIPHTLHTGDICIIPPHTKHSVSILCGRLRRRMG